MDDRSQHIRQTFNGLPGAPGQARGLVCHWRSQPQLPTSFISTLSPRDALTQAIAAAEAQLITAISRADATLAPLLDAQRLMLGDPEFLQGAETGIANGLNPVEAVAATSEQMAAILEAADSLYFRERAIDVRAVGALVAQMLLGATARRVPPNVVVVADELSPLDTAELADAKVAALVTVKGGPTCHAAIIARAWGIPAVVGAPPAVLEIAPDTPLLVDGTRGRLIVAPVTADEVTESAPQVSLARRIPVYANIGSLAEAERARELGADGIGLLRTEFLFQNRLTPPTEEEQTAQYLAIARTQSGRPVVIRTLDIGADKPVPFLHLPPEPNPQLGLRGIRLCLREEALFRVQLRALIRAAEAYPIQILLPMVTGPDEVRYTHMLLEIEAAALGLPAPPLGVMIEVPMAALAAPELAAICDFISLGTNDLMQFLLAADRQLADVGYLHDLDATPAWRLLSGVIHAAHRAGIPVSVCGEWGADPEKLPRLVELGITSTSVAVAAVPRVRGWLPE